MKHLNLLAAACVALSAGAAQAGTVFLQPNEADGKDVFVYAFDVPGAFGLPGTPSDRNWDSDTPAVGPFGAFLGAAKTEPFNDPGATPPTPPGVAERRHDSNVLVEFDLSSVGFDAGKVASGILTLTGAGALGAFDAPTEDFPVTIDARPVLEAWGEQDVTWNTRPGVGDVIASQVMTGGFDSLKFDVTDLVKAWLADPSTNFGVEFSQREIVQFPAAPGERGRFAAGNFASSSNGRFAGPSLSVSEVPVPAALPLLATGLAVFGLMRRRARG